MRLLRRGNKNGDFCCVEEIKYLYLQKKYNYGYKRNYKGNHSRKS